MLTDPYGNPLHTQSAAAADAAWDIVLDALLVQTAALLILGAVVAFAAWALGPSSTATS